MHGDSSFHDPGSASVVGTPFHGLVANPTITEVDGVLVLAWPGNAPDVCLVARDLMVEMVAELNLHRPSGNDVR